MLVSLGGTPTRRLYTGLCKFKQNISTNIWSLGKRTELKLVWRDALDYSHVISKSREPKKSARHDWKHKLLKKEKKKTAELDIKCLFVHVTGSPGISSSFQLYKMSYLFISNNIIIYWLYTLNCFRIIFVLRDIASQYFVKYSYFELCSQKENESLYNSEINCTFEPRLSGLVGTTRNSPDNWGSG